MRIWKYMSARRRRLSWSTIGLWLIGGSILGEKEYRSARRRAGGQRRHRELTQASIHRAVAAEWRKDADFGRFQLGGASGDELCCRHQRASGGSFEMEGVVGVPNARRAPDQPVGERPIDPRLVHQHGSLAVGRQVVERHSEEALPERGLELFEG